MTYSTEQLKDMCPVEISKCSQKHVQSVIEELIETALAQPASVPAGRSQLTAVDVATLSGLMHDAAIRYANGYTVNFDDEASDFLVGAAPQPAQADAFMRAVEVRTAQGWNIDSGPVPVLYTDTINEQQVCRDDVWLCKTEHLKSKGEAAPQLNLNDPSVQKRLAAQWGYVQAPAPGDALLPMIERLEDAASAALTQAHNSGKVVHKAGVYMPAIETGAELARAIIALRDFASKGAEPHVWLYDFIDGETTVRNWSTTNKAEAFAPGNFNQRGYVPAEN